MCSFQPDFAVVMSKTSEHPYHQVDNIAPFHVMTEIHGLQILKAVKIELGPGSGGGAEGSDLKCRLGAVHFQPHSVGWIRHLAAVPDLTARNPRDIQLCVSPGRRGGEYNFINSLR